MQYVRRPGLVQSLEGPPAESSTLRMSRTGRNSEPQRTFSRWSFSVRRNPNSEGRGGRQETMGHSEASDLSASDETHGPTMMRARSQISLDTLSKRIRNFDRSSHGSFCDEIKLSDCGKQICSAHLEKKIVGTVVTWVSQGVVLTDRKICFLIDNGVIRGEDIVIDYIPLHEVVQLIVEGENKLEEEAKLCLVIRTVDGGFNSGRTYVCRMTTEKECLAWHQNISGALKEAMSKRKEESELKAIGDSKLNWLRFKVSGGGGGGAFDVVYSGFPADHPELHRGGNSQDPRRRSVHHGSNVVSLCAVRRPFQTVLGGPIEPRGRCHRHRVHCCHLPRLSSSAQGAGAGPDLQVTRQSRASVEGEGESCARLVHVFRRVKSLNRILTSLGRALVPLVN
eukprot:762467-Hanusia_phi.AAC.1